MSSFWIDSSDSKTNFKKIDNNYECDVCIIGGGLTGLNIGYYLSKIGFKVIILEREHSIGLKTSGNTTGKITYQHNLKYNQLISSHGEKYAKAYLEANKNAIENIKNIIDLENIDCDFEYQDNYIYTTKQNELTKIHDEIEALHILGEDSNIEFVTSSDLPFKIAGGILTKNQAQFNSIKYMYGLANCILNNGSLIFCDSTAFDFEKNGDNFVVNANHNKIQSKYLVVASHYPFKKIMRFLFCKNVSIYFICVSN